MEAFFRWSRPRTRPRFRSVPVERSSITVTSFRATSRSIRWDPMKPAPPVTRIRAPSISSARTERVGITFPLHAGRAGGSPFLRRRPAALVGTEAGELHAHVVQATSGGGILRLPGRSLDLSVDEILPAQVRHGRRRDQE